MSTLTQRYIEEVVSHLPEASRPDMSRELEALIADMVDERSTAGVAPGPAERSALEELGDPARLAARYRDAPAYLIGPRLYPAFIAGLRWLLPLVLLIALAVNVVVYAATEPDPQLGQLLGVLIGRVLSAVFTVAGVFTLVFAVLERTLPRADQDRFGAGRRGWTVDELGAERSGHAGVRSDAIAGLVFVVIMALVPVIPTSFLYVGHLNDGGPFINQALWALWLPAYYVLLGLAAAVETWALVAGRWTRPQVMARVAVALAFAVLLSQAILTQQVLDPAIPVGDIPLTWTPWFTVAVIWVARCGPWWARSARGGRAGPTDPDRPAGGGQVHHLPALGDDHLPVLHEGGSGGPGLIHQWAPCGPRTGHGAGRLAGADRGTLAAGREQLEDGALEVLTPAVAVVRTHASSVLLRPRARQARSPPVRWPSRAGSGGPWVSSR